MREDGWYTLAQGRLKSKELRIGPTEYMALESLKWEHGEDHPG